MLLHLTALLLLPLGALTAAVHPPQSQAVTPRAVSPDNTCGADHSGYTCPGALPCCSQYGFCGATDAFCLTTAKCQTRFSNSSAACHAPVPGTSVSIDGTCGTEGAGKEGYRCPGNATVTSCCSAATPREGASQSSWISQNFPTDTSTQGHLPKASQAAPMRVLSVLSLPLVTELTDHCRAVVILIGDLYLVLSVLSLGLATELTDHLDHLPGSLIGPSNDCLGASRDPRSLLLAYS
ncbi:predicted protein [Chaetomium globosum CBS 148.51]|uniref:Chitin-binding type-1 domain-containing protein n=1 Tax=Chaetomium globosum (strain ATCC 6205 / CBS 148.51 / DSM 1962 / NBRC 6347 / NRRL 1970) TaxID=306901 RepID=Q2H2H8_CHAGB|nr:uncharacterized protein CHGG_04018 [Chaetomium globosum CBS 148.51]EAQ87399.1 predicted protein [Chaetomium globosum CBS 148.51]